jgi:hypothetical protein
MELIKLFLILFILFIIIKKPIKENMQDRIKLLNVHTPPKSLDDYIQKKIIYPKKNETYYEKIEKPHNELNQFFNVKNYNNTQDSQFNQPTMSEIENNKFIFNSSINNQKQIIEPNIDSSSQDTYYIKSYNNGNTVYKRDNWMYSNEGAMNGGYFYNNIHGYDTMNNNYYY